MYGTVARSRGDSSAISLKNAVWLIFESKLGSKIRFGIKLVNLNRALFRKIVSLILEFVKILLIDLPKL